jgi:hypothetical protein
MEKVGVEHTKTHRINPIEVRDFVSYVNGLYSDIFKFHSNSDWFSKMIDPLERS